MELFRSTTRAMVACAAILAAGLVINSLPMRADGRDEGEDNEQARIKKGFAIAPVRLNLKGKDRELVGYGSYIVNGQGDCNGCHSSGPSGEYVAGGNPYFGQHPTKIDPANYLGGGRNFGSLIPGSAEIISRNLTPDKNTGRPEGGNTFEEFKKIIRTGVDQDKWHPMCSGAPGTHCIPAPFDGSLLQIMPWPVYRKMTDHDLRAIYEYLSSIPCLEGDPGNPDGADTMGNRCN